MRLLYVKGQTSDGVGIPQVYKQAKSVALSGRQKPLQDLPFQI